MATLFTDADVEALKLQAPRSKSIPGKAMTRPELIKFLDSKRAEAQGSDILGNLFNDATLAELGIPVEEARFRPKSKMTPLEIEADRHAIAVASGEGHRIKEPIGIGTRAAASFKFDRQAVYNYLRETYGKENVAPSRNPDSGEVTNFVIRDKDGRVKVFDPEGLDWGDPLDLARDVAEAGLGAAGGIIAGVASGGNPLAIAAGAAAGDALGGAGTQAIGAAMPGSEKHVTGRQRAVSTAINVGAGLIAPAAPAIVRGAGRLAQKSLAALPRFVPGASAAAEAVAKREIANKITDETAEQAVRSIGEKTVNSYTKESEDLLKRVGAAIGEPGYSLSAGKMTGSKYALGVERTLSQSPETMERMALQAQRELLGAAKFADSIVQHVASNPDKLGNSSVGENVANAIKRHIGNLVKLRSEQAGPLYDRATNLFGGRRIVPTDATRAAMTDIVRGNKFGPDEITSQAKSALAKVEAAASQGGRMSVEDVQNLRALWGEAARGDVDVIKGLSRRNQKRLARNVLAAIDTDLSAAARGIQGEAAATLQEANRVWAEHSRAIDNVIGQRTVKRILKLSDDANDAQITKTLGKLDPSQRRGVMQILEKTDPETAANLRAQILANVFEAGGKPHASTEFGQELISSVSDTGVRPTKLRNQIVKSADMIGDLYGNDVVTRRKVIDLVGLLDRLGAGPGWAGSDTVPKGLLAGILGAFKAVAPGAVGQAAEAAQRAISKGVADPETLMRILASPEDAATAHVWLRPLLEARKPTPSMLDESLKAMVRLTALYGADEIRDSDVADEPPTEAAGTPDVAPLPGRKS